ncbi:MAG: hypothetical protein Ct9H300mP23_12180 [Nitrospinota bacterium]|nr:MAG: hypothetical protein Ct9H300mP23_12180 [Nitrospinota bacterium]
MVAPDGKIMLRANSFTEELICSDIALNPKSPKKLYSKTNIRSYQIPASLSKQKKYPPLSGYAYNKKSEVENIFSALVLGTQDYVSKNGFSKAVLGLSGGIDSALTAVVASKALGAKNVIGVLMPSPHFF